VAKGDTLPSLPFLICCKHVGRWVGGVGMVWLAEKKVQLAAACA
jgi:hypothetical protein